MKNLLKVRGMSRLARLGLVVGGIGVAGVMAAGPSFASVSTNAIPNGVATTTGNAATPQANGTSVTHYSVSYVDPIFGPVSCVGVHQVKKGSATQDSFTCTSTNGGLAGVTLGQSLALGTAPTWWGWYSDFDGQAAKSLSGTVSANGMSYTAVATY
jgi:hypothetical protein